MQYIIEAKMTRQTGKERARTRTVRKTSGHFMTTCPNYSGLLTKSSNGNYVNGNYETMVYKWYTEHQERLKPVSDHQAHHDDGDLSICGQDTREGSVHPVSQLTCTPKADFQYSCGVQQPESPEHPENCAKMDGKHISCIWYMVRCRSSLAVPIEVDYLTTFVWKSTKVRSTLWFSCRSASKSNGNRVWSLAEAWDISQS